jgi:hypothetical protein
MSLIIDFCEPFRFSLPPYHQRYLRNEPGVLSASPLPSNPSDANDTRRTMDLRVQIRNLRPDLRKAAGDLGPYLRLVSDIVSCNEGPGSVGWLRQFVCQDSMD